MKLICANEAVKVEARRQDLDAIVSAFGHIDVVVRRDGYSEWEVELQLPIPLAPNDAQQLSSFWMKYVNGVIPVAKVTYQHRRAISSDRDATTIGKLRSERARHPAAERRPEEQRDEAAVQAANGPRHALSAAQSRDASLRVREQCDNAQRRRGAAGRDDDGSALGKCAQRLEVAFARTAVGQCADHAQQDVEVKQNKTNNLVSKF
jgi:hypothetical protein